MKPLRYEIVIEKEEDPRAGYSVYCPDLPGCFSNGSTPKQARDNMAEAIALHVESLRALGKGIPKPRRRVRVEEITVAQPA